MPWQGSRADKSPGSLLQISPVFPGVSFRDLSYILFRNLFGLFQFRKNGEFRTNKTAKTAIHTILSKKHQFGRVIALGIKRFTLFQTSVGAKFNAESATFAPILYDSNVALWDRMSFSI